MSTFVKFSVRVIGVVAVGAGVAAVGWLGWKAYVKARAPVVQIGDSDEAQADIVLADVAHRGDCHAPDEDNIVPPQDAEKADAVPEAPAPKARKTKKPNKALWSKSYQRRLTRRAQERAERLALQLQASGEVPSHESCCALALPAVPADDEDVPAPASTVEPANEEHIPVPIQHESVDEVTPSKPPSK